MVEKGRKILFVEGDGSMISILAKALGRQNELSFVQSALEMRALLAVKSYDLVLLNVFIKEGDIGASLIPEVLASGHRVAMFTGADDEQTKAQCKRFPLDGFITKMQDPANWGTSILKILDGTSVFPDDWFAAEEHGVSARYQRDVLPEVHSIAKEILNYRFADPTCTRDELSARLAVTPHRLNLMIAKLMQQLGVDREIDMVAAALRRGYLPNEPGFVSKGGHPS